MGRPRICVRVIVQPDGTLAHSVKKNEGREIHGLSFNKSNRSYYTIDEATGNRVYRGTDLMAAVRSVERIEFDADDYRRQMQASETKSGAWETLTKLIQNGSTGDALKLLDKAREVSGAPSAEKLSDCLILWLALREEEKDTKTQYHVDVERAFNRFITVVGDLPISHVTPDHFAEWRRWVKREAKKPPQPGGRRKDGKPIVKTNPPNKKRSHKWSQDQHKYVATILRTCREEKPSWQFPAGLLGWAKLPKEQSKKIRYTPDKKNRDPLPVDIFQTVITQCRTLASATTDAMKTLTQGDKAKIGVVKVRIKRGIQLEAMFRIAVNCGFDNADFCGNEERDGLQWLDLHLDRKVAFTDLARVKTGCERMTPLLPSTVAALKRWRTLTNGMGYTFKTEQGKPHTSTTVHDQLADMMEGAEVRNGWTFKHLRNVGGTLGRKFKLSLFEVEAFLGHTINGQSRFYMGDVDETYLVKLVNRIGAEYFDGEHVNT